MVAITTRASCIELKWQAARYLQLLIFYFTTKLKVNSDCALNSIIHFILLQRGHLQNTCQNQR